MKLSPSKVDCFMGCRRLYFYRYIKKLPSKPNRYFLIGNVCHKTLELFYQKAKLENKDRWQELIERAFKYTIEKYKAREKVETGFLEKKDLYSMKEMMKNYMELVQSNGGLPNIESMEKRFEIKLDQVVIVGRANRVDRIEDGFVVVDYKTSSKPFTKKEVKESVQLPTYGLWMHQTYPDAKFYGQYIWLKHLNKKQKFEITKDVMAEAIDKYTQVKFSLENGCKMVRDRSYKFCFMCEYKNFCTNDKQDDFYQEK